MDELRIFYDTEFTDLSPGAGLISVGFASETGKTLYIELTDGWTRNECSDFVVSAVLPLLGWHAPRKFMRDEAAIAITQWINVLRNDDRETPIIFLSDSLWDWDHLKDLFPWVPGSEPWSRAENICGRLISHELGTSARAGLFEQLIAEWSSTEPEVHHALVDARALRDAFVKVQAAFSPGHQTRKTAAQR